MLVVYGVVRANHPGVTTTGVHGAETTTTRSGALAAIVSEADGELLARRRDVEAHLGVLESALRDGDVLPFRFGTVIDDEQHMRRLLDESATHYHRLLDRVSGCVQMTLKAVRDDDQSVRVAVGADDNLRRAAQRWSNSSVVSERIALGERVAAAVERLGRHDADRIVSQLRGVAKELSVEPVSPPAVVTVSMLVQPDRLPDLDQAVAALHDELGERISFDYAGPMPAYSFVT